MKKSYKTKQGVTSLNALNFFLAEVGVILPFLATYLKEHHWTYAQIGIALSLGAAGSFLFQILAGIISDRVRNKKNLMASSAIAFGITYFIIIHCPDSVGFVSFLIFLTGLWGTFFIPLLGALALALSKKDEEYERLIGKNRTWYHIGNLAVASLAMRLIDHYGIASVFVLVTIISLLAACMTLFMTNEEARAKEKVKSFKLPPLSEIYKDTKTVLQKKTVLILFLFITIFHTINAPLMPMVGLYLKQWVNDPSPWISAAVMLTQGLMIFVALFSGNACQAYGRKSLLGVAFLAIPIRALLCSLTSDPYALVAIQCLDSLTAGLYGIVICLIAGDLSQGKKGFSTLLGVFQTALALGGILGPFIQGFLTTYFGFKITFIIFFVFSLVAFIGFVFFMPETRKARQEPLALGLKTT
ncbi:MAG: MFS transporter [Legionella sp.]|nr:MFS transporter [Legionella sp.]